MDNKRPFYLAFLILFAFVLTSCLTPPMYDEMLADQKKMDKELKKINPAYNPKHNAVKVKCGPYVDTTPVCITSMPAWLNDEVPLKGRMLPLDFYMKDLLK